MQLKLPTNRLAANRLTVANWLAVISILSLTMGTALVAPAVAPPDPQPLPLTGNCVHDNIFYGAVPEGGEEGRVLVFVHGLSGLAEDWWSDNTLAGLNDMYLLAYEAGYRTAFVNLNVKRNIFGNCFVLRRPAYDMTENGLILNEQIEAILQHYNAEQIDIIAHSKGGIDAQAAVVWRGDWRRVRNLFTLATPHQGNLLADLLWSPEGFWVSLILGQRDDATQSLTTASMQIFRLATDATTVDEAVHYYTGAGNFWQTPDSLFEVTGEWLQNEPGGGDNDGVVTVASTDLPKADTLFLEPWNHNETYMGRNAFPYIHQILLEQEVPEFSLYLPLILASDETTTRPEKTPLHQSNDRLTLPPSNYILRGGRLAGASPKTETIPVEPQAQAVRFSLLTTHEQVTATLVDPQGRQYPLSQLPVENQGLLAAVVPLTHFINHPLPGQWQLHLNSPTEAGYTLIVTFDSELHLGLDGWPGQPVSPDEPVTLTARLGSVSDLGNASGSNGANTSTQTEPPVLLSRISLKTISSAPRLDKKPLEPVATGAIKAAGDRTGVSLSYRFAQEDIYGLSVTVTGQTSEGYPFERSFVRSLAVQAAAEPFQDQ